MRGDAGPLIRRGAAAAIPLGLLIYFGLRDDSEGLMGISLAATVAGFVAFDAPALTRAGWQLAFAPFLAIAGFAGVLTAEFDIPAILTMTAFGIAAGCTVAVSARLSVAGLMIVLGLLLAQGLGFLTDQAPAAGAAAVAGTLVQVAVSLVSWAAGDRGAEEGPGLRERLASGRQALASELRGRSATLIHAIRWGLALGAGVTVYRFVDLQEHGYWVPLTVLFVLRPTTDETWERVAMRALGTVVGLIVATGLAEALGTHTLPVAICLAGTMALAYAYLTLEYAIFTWAITVFVVLLTDAQGYGAFAVAGDRALGTAVGIAIAVLAIALPTPAATPPPPRGTA